MSKELNKGIPKAVVVGKVEYSAEEQEQHDADFEMILKQYGVLKENQSIKDMNKPKF